MELLKTWALRGAHRWAGVPVLEIELDHGPERVGDANRLRDLLLDHQRRCGSDVRFGQVVPMPGAGRCRVVVEFEEEEVVLACLSLALDTIRAERAGQPLDPAPRL